ncbi:hypothetical protein ACF0H5_014076 [Mactra antiquata]
MDKLLVLYVVVVCSVVGSVTLIPIEETERDKRWTTPEDLIVEMLTDAIETTNFQKLPLADQEFVDTIISAAKNKTLTVHMNTPGAIPKMVDRMVGIFPSIDRNRFHNLLGQSFLDENHVIII